MFGFTPPHVLGLVAGVIGIIGVILPWATVMETSTTSANGTATYSLVGMNVGIGILTLLLSVVCILVILAVRNKPKAKVSGEIMFGIGLVITLFVGFAVLTFSGITGQLQSIVTPPTSTFNQIQVGVGLIMEGFAGFIIIISGIWSMLL